MQLGTALISDFRVLTGDADNARVSSSIFSVEYLKVYNSMLAEAYCCIYDMSSNKSYDYIMLKIFHI